MAPSTKRRRLDCFAVLTLLFSLSHASLVNVTIDDTNGDAETGLKPIFKGNWFSPSLCALKLSNDSCTLGLDLPQAHEMTWSGTIDPSSSIEILFNGSAIYAFFILPVVSLEPRPEFVLDGKTMSPTSTPKVAVAVQYNVPLFSATNLEDTQHNLTIVTDALGLELILGKRTAAGVVFDYAIYSRLGLDKTMSPPTGGSTDPSQPSAPLSLDSGLDSGLRSTSNAAAIQLPQTGEVAVATSNNPLLVDPSQTPDLLTSTSISAAAAVSATLGSEPTPSPSASSSGPLPGVDVTSPADSHPSLIPGDASTAPSLFSGGLPSTQTSRTAGPSFPSPSTLASPTRHSIVGVTVGAVIGGAGFLFFALCALFICRRRLFRGPGVSRFLRRGDSERTINSFYVPEFPMPPACTFTKKLFPTAIPSSPSAEHLIAREPEGRSKQTHIPPQEATAIQDEAPRPTMDGRPALSPIFAHSSGTPPFESPLSAVAPSPISFSGEADFLYRISVLEAEVERLQFERAHMHALAVDEELPDYTDVRSNNGR